MSSSSNSQQDPNAYGVVAVSPNRLLDGRRYVCDTCYRGFVREQNLVVHGRHHNRPFHLKKTITDDTKKVYLCPEPNCINHELSHALKTFGGLKKHYLRKHVPEKQYKCTTCSKAYAALADLKAHSKTCGVEKHRCSCGDKFQKKHDLTRHQERCIARQQTSAINHSATVDIGNSSVTVTGNNNTESPIHPSMSLPPAFSTGASSVGYPQFSSIQTSSSNPYCTVEFMESQLPGFVIHDASLMTNHSMGLNSDQNVDPSYFPSILQNQHELQQTYEDGFFTELLMNDNVSLDNFNLDNTSFNGGNDYMTQDVDDTGLNDMMRYGYGGWVGSFNQDYGQGYYR